MTRKQTDMVIVLNTSIH